MYVSDKILGWFFIKSYFRYNDLLHRFNVCKLPREENQVVDFSVTDEIATSVTIFWKDLEYAPLI